MGLPPRSAFRFSSLYSLVLAAALPALLAKTAFAEDWAQFRGPNGQGRSSQTGPPIKWSEEAGVAWKVAVEGLGWSSPVILDKQIWFTTATRNGHSLRVLCARTDTGKIECDVEVFTPTSPLRVNPKNSHASPSAVIEPGRVYVHFGAMGTACLDTTTGNVLWRNENLVIDHKEGPGSSPILFENLLIVNCDGQDQQFIAALDKTTGKPVWTTTRSVPYHVIPDFRKAFATPALIEVGGKPQLVSTGANQVNVLDPRTGREILRVQYNGFSNVPVPLVGRDRVYVVTDFTRPQLWAIRTGGQGDVTDTNVVWKLTRQVGSSPSPVLFEDRIYLVTNRGVATCVEAETGNVIWQHRLGGDFSASVVELGGHIYFSSEEGKTTVIRPDREFHPIATNELDGRIFATPAVLDHSLIVRTDSHLYRIDASSATASTPRRTTARDDGSLQSRP